MKYPSLLKAALVTSLAVASAPALAQTKVTLMYTATAPFVSAFVAEDQGFFDR